MNEPVRSQGEAARQSVADAYRGQLRLLRNGVDEWWRVRAAELEKAPDFPAGFPEVLRASGADFRDSAGS